jgi:F-type H+-transporting ATPase subunit b
MVIDWWTLGLQALNFLVLVWLLWRFLFKPVKGIIARRRKMAEDARGELEDARKAAETEKAQYEKSRQDLADERRDLLKKAHDDMAAEREAMLEAAREEARQITDGARKAVAEDQRRAMDALKGDIASLAGDMAAHVLQSAAPEAYTSLLLERLAAAVTDLPADEKERLRSDAESAPVTVATVRALDEKTQQSWRKKLGPMLPADTDIRFEEDASLGGGAELRLAHTVVTYSWVDQVKQAEAALKAEDTPHE